MRIEVSEFEKSYAFELKPITQLCGQNIARKTYILESIRKYFSTYKYAEIKNRWRDNVTIDGELVGRKYFSVLSVQGISDLLTMIKWSKQSLMLEYVKSLMQKFDWQMHLEIINDELEEMFQLLNKEIEVLGDIEINYSTSEVWDMIQKSNVTGKNETNLEDKESGELIFIALNLVEEVLKATPKKMLVIFENIDHILSVKEYRNMIDRMQQISEKFDIYFLITTSLDKYVVCQENLCAGITAFNDLDFQFPELEELQNAINDNYPCNKIFDQTQISEMIESIAQRIGKTTYLDSIEENVICKIINKSMLLNDRWQKNEIAPEIGFLKV